MTTTIEGTELLAALEALTKHSEGTNEAFYVQGTTKALRSAFKGQKELLQAARSAIAKATGGGIDRSNRGNEAQR